MCQDRNASNAYSIRTCQKVKCIALFLGEGDLQNYRECHQELSSSSVGFTLVDLFPQRQRAILSLVKVEGGAHLPVEKEKHKLPINQTFLLLQGCQLYAYTVISEVGERPGTLIAHTRNTSKQYPQHHRYEHVCHPRTPQI